MEVRRFSKEAGKVRGSEGQGRTHLLEEEIVEDQACQGKECPDEAGKEVLVLLQESRIPKNAWIPLCWGGEVATKEGTQGGTDGPGWWHPSEGLRFVRMV